MSGTILTFFSGFGFEVERVRSVNKYKQQRHRMFVIGLSEKLVCVPFTSNTIEDVYLETPACSRMGVFSLQTTTKESLSKSLDK